MGVMNAMLEITGTEEETGIEEEEVNVDEEIEGRLINVLAKESNFISNKDVYEPNVEGELWERIKKLGHTIGIEFGNKQSNKPTTSFELNISGKILDVHFKKDQTAHEAP